MRFIVSNMDAEKRSCRNASVKAKVKKVRTLQEVLELEGNLANTDFRSKWIEEFQDATAPFIAAKSDNRAIGKIVLKAIFHQLALRNICYAGRNGGKFALKPRDEMSNILSALTEIFNFHGVHKYVKIKQGIQETIYKSNDDLTRKLRLRQNSKKASV
ncbi:hypothetical protein B566_EDAN016098 [Ephemera danica]|nr:hypothetical protein B566_EDAN016098 [Ephemera danica]